MLFEWNWKDPSRRPQGAPFPGSLDRTPPYLFRLAAFNVSNPDSRGNCALTNTFLCTQTRCRDKTVITILVIVGIAQRIL